MVILLVRSSEKRTFFPDLWTTRKGKKNNSEKNTCEKWFRNWEKKNKTTKKNEMLEQQKEKTLETFFVEKREILPESWQEDREESRKTLKKVISVLRKFLSLFLFSLSQEFGVRNNIKEKTVQGSPSTSRDRDSVNRRRLIKVPSFSRTQMNRKGWWWRW
jgi:hypothetical protein